MTGSKEMFQQERELHEIYGLHENGEAEDVTPNEEQPLSLKTLALFETTKLQRMGFVGEILDRIDAGEADPLLIHLQLKSANNISEMLTDKKKYPEIADRYSKALLTAAEKYGQKKFDFHNASIEIKEVGVSYNWEKTEDPILLGLLEQQENLKKEIEQRQDFLKTVPAKGMEVVSNDEVIKVYPPAKSSTTSIAVTLK